jgi:hypothetical protein
MISDFEFLDAGQVDHLEPVLFGTDAAGFDIIVERLGHAGDQKFIARPAELRAHVGLFPLRRAGVLGEHAHALRLKALQLRADQLIREAAHGAIAGFDGDVVIRREFALGQPAPEQRRSVTQESGPDVPSQMSTISEPAAPAKRS